MAKIMRSVMMRFDLSYPPDALTYSRLKDSAERAGRRGRGRQSEYLLSILFKGREFKGLRTAGLDEWPVFPNVVDEIDGLETRIVALEQGIRSLYGIQVAPKPSCLRLVPMGQQSTGSLEPKHQWVADEGPDVSA